MDAYFGGYVWTDRRGRQSKAVRQATPEWADRPMIRAIYARARAVSLETGRLHHVDHIIPLRHDLVCGLHVENNLRVIEGAENCRKSNRWEEKA